MNPVRAAATNFESLVLFRFLFTTIFFLLVMLL